MKNQIGVLEIKGKTVITIKGRGDYCECGDCPVLYGDTCPFDDVKFREKYSRLKKKSPKSQGIKD